MSVQQRTPDPNSNMRFQNFRVPDHQSEDSVEDLEAQNSEDMEGDISEGSAELNVEGGMTVAFKVLQPWPSVGIFAQLQAWDYAS